MSTVDYSPKQHSYQVVNADTILGTFPAGPDGRTEAQRFALDLDHPEIAQALHQFEKKNRRHLRSLGLRPLRAAELVAAEALSPNGTPGSFYARSQRDRTRRYCVEPPTCNCPDWQHGRDGHKHGAPIIKGYPLCKHLIALTLNGTPTIRTRPTWTAGDAVCDLFPATVAEFYAMRQLWPDAYGPSLKEITAYGAPPTACCHAGHVGQMRRDGRFNYGDMYCWNCRKYLGEY